MIKPKTKFTIASTPPLVVKLLMKEVKAKQGNATFMTTLVRVLPVPCGKIFQRVRKKPSRMIMMVLAIALQRLVELIALAILSPIDAAARMENIEIHPPFTPKISRGKRQGYQKFKAR